MEISGLSSLLWPPPSSIVLLAVPAAPCYAAQGDILPDGSQAGEARQWLQRHRAEQELAAAEQAVQQGVKVRPLLLLDLFYCDGHCQAGAATIAWAALAPRVRRRNAAADWCCSPF